MKQLGVRYCVLPESVPSTLVIWRGSQRRSDYALGQMLPYGVVISSFKGGDEGKTMKAKFGQKLPLSRGFRDLRAHDVFGAGVKAIIYQLSMI